MLEFLRGGEFLNWQIDYLLYLQHFREMTGGCLNSAVLFITKFGEMLFPLLFVSWIYWCIDKKQGIFLLLNSAYAVLLNQALKMTACVYRPWVLSSDIHPLPEAFAHAGGYSFPSGHTTFAVAIWGGCAFQNWKNLIIRYSGISMVILIALSRNYLGVHTPQDVIVAFILGVILFFVTAALIKWVDRKEERDILFLIFGFLLIAALVAYITFKNYPIDILNGVPLVSPEKMKPALFMYAGYAAGVFSGWFLERRYIKFDPKKGNEMQKTIRFLLGGIILFAIMYFKETFTGSLGILNGLFVNYFVVGLFITAIYPFLFSKKMPE